MERIRDLDHLRQVYIREMRVERDGSDLDTAGFWPTTLNMERNYLGDGEMCLLLAGTYAVNLAELCAWVCAEHEPARMTVIPRRALRPGQLSALAALWRLRPDWHEPDEQDVSAKWKLQDGDWIITLIKRESEDEAILVDVHVDDLLAWALSTSVSYGLAEPTRVSDLGALLLGDRVLA